MGIKHFLLNVSVKNTLYNLPIYEQLLAFLSHLEDIMNLMHGMNS